jgi:hypothetical protein
MLAGIAQLDITPPIGTALTGYIARDGGATGVHDPLYAKALVLAEGEEQAALLTCDLLGLRLQEVMVIRHAIAMATGLPDDHILITCSHTHAGPATIDLQDCGVVDEEYLGQLRQKLVRVTEQALATLRPTRFGVGHGQVTTGVHNRRTPGDVIDPDLGVLRLVDEAGTTFGVVVNYACHPTCLTGENRLLSAEYCGYAMAQIEQLTGATALFITGAIGDVGPVARGWPILEELGTTIAQEAVRVLAGIETTEWHGLRGASQPLTLPLLPAPTVEELHVFMDYWRQPAARPDSPLPPHPKIAPAMLHWAERTLAQIQDGTVATHVTTEVQVIRVGALALVSAPGELFVELGLAVKAQAGVAHLFLCGFANDNIGYIPARRAYPHGGYEINEAYKYYGSPAALAPEAGEVYVNAAVALVSNR